jgi:hypothetical protein
LRSGFRFGSDEEPKKKDDLVSIEVGYESTGCGADKSTHIDVGKYLLYVCTKLCIYKVTDTGV